MEWQRPLMTTAEKVFDAWLRRTHGDAFAADYYREDDPEMRIDRDPRNYPRWMTKNDGPLYGKGEKQ